MTFQLKDEYISCKDYSSFLDSLTSWVTNERTSINVAVSIFEPISRHKTNVGVAVMEPKMQKAYCFAQQLDFKAMQDRRVDMMWKCVKYKKEESAKLIQDPTVYNKGMLAERDSKLMELEIKKQKVHDFAQYKFFKGKCKDASYGKADRYDAFVDVKDGTLFEKYEQRIPS